MQATPLTKASWDRIVQVIDAWSGGMTRSLAHPIFFYELGEMARVIEQEGEVVAFLLGFVAPTSPPTGYVHLAGVHPDHRRRHLGRFLYEWFEGECRSRGISEVKAITPLGNEVSLRFHQAIGWDAHEVADYAGAGRPRIVFRKSL